EVSARRAPTRPTSPRSALRAVAPRWHDRGMAVTADVLVTDRLAAISAELSQVLEALVPEDVALPKAADVYNQFAAIERLGKAGCTLMARRVAESEEWRRSGFPSPAEWIAHQKQSSLGEARDEA